MSGQTEASFFITQAQRLSDGTVAERVRRLFSVEIALAPVPAEAAAGTQQTQAQGSWVTLSTSNGCSDNTEKAKNYIHSLCMPESVEECFTDPQSVEQLLSDTSSLRDSLEMEYQTAITPAKSPSCVSVQGYDVLAVQKTIASIQAAMSPPPNNNIPQHQPHLDSQSRISPTTTAGTFSPSPPLPPSISLSSTNDASERQQNLDRVTPHQLTNIPTPGGRTQSPHSSSPRRATMTEKEKLLQKIAAEIENDSSNVLPRGIDSSHHEQTIQYFSSLNFPREKIETVVGSMGPWAEYDDILKRLNMLHVTSSRPLANLQKSREYTNTGEPLLNSNATLRPVVIDGSNVAMRHGNGRVFSCRGIQTAVDWFRQRGHKEITVFVPQWRREAPRAEYPITDQEILNQLEREETLSFTPSRRIGNKRIVCYDDRFIVKLASETNGVIVSNDNFRDLAEENEKWRKTIEHRLVMFTFANDMFMVPEDPLGKHGPRLNQLLQMEPPKSSLKLGGASSDRAGSAVCPYGERCTFGRRCRFSHPERDVLTSRSPNASPSPSDRRHTNAVLGDDLQKDYSSVNHPSDRLSPSSGGPTGQPTHTSPHKPRTSPLSTQTASPPPPPHGYSQPHSIPHGYSQPLTQSEPTHYSHSQPHSFSQQQQQRQCDYSSPHPSFRSGGSHNNPPLYLGIPTTTNTSSLSSQHPSSVLHTSPGRSNPSTPMGGGGGMASYPSRTFPIANLSIGRPRNMTDRVQVPIPSGNEDFIPSAPNMQPIIPPHQHIIEPPPGLIPRGDYTTTHYHHSHLQPPSHGYHHPTNPHAGNTHSVNPHAGNPHSVNPHAGNPHSVNPHAGNPHEMYQPYSNYHHHPQSHHTHHPTYHMHSNAYPTPTQPSSNLHHQQQQQQQQHYTNQPTDYLQQQQQQPPRSTSGDSRNTLQGPRAASMYGDMGMRRHDDNIALTEKFQTSMSSPELYRDINKRRYDHHYPPPQATTNSSSSNSTSVNWNLFKQAQERLPNQEEQIMKMMQHHPNADLEHLVDLIQRPQW